MPAARPATVRSSPMAAAQSGPVFAAAPAAATAAAPTRQAWLDAARGAVVFLVVLMHLVNLHYLPLLGGLDDAISAAWIAFNDLAAGVRMPALLLISGWLASSRVLQGLRNPRTRRTLVTSAWLYVIWLTVYAGFTLIEGENPNAVQGWEGYLSNLVMPDTSLWFIAALFWYVFVLAALRAVPAPFMVAATLGVGWAIATMLQVDDLWARIPGLAVFFALGVYGRRWLSAAAAAPLAGLAAAAVWAVLWTADLSATPRIEYPLTVVSSVAAVVALLALFALLSAVVPALTAPMAWLGRRTLGVYVLHFPVLSAVTLLLTQLVIDADGPLGRPAVLWLYPVAATLLVVVASVVLESFLRRAGATWLFALPGRRPPAGEDDRPPGPRRWMALVLEPDGGRHE